MFKKTALLFVIVGLFNASAFADQKRSLECKVSYKIWGNKVPRPIVDHDLIPVQLVDYKPHQYPKAPNPVDRALIEASATAEGHAVRLFAMGVADSKEQKDTLNVSLLEVVPNVTGPNATSDIEFNLASGGQVKSRVELDISTPTADDPYRVIAVVANCLVRN